MLAAAAIRPLPFILISKSSKFALQAEFSPFLRPVAGAIIDCVKQMGDRRVDSVAPEHVQRGARSAFELWSGKVPLRSIQRIGILLLNGVPLLFLIFFGARGISALKGAPTLVL